MKKDLAEVARHWGIETQYQDVFGRARNAGTETLVRLIAAMSAANVQPQNFDLAAPDPLRAFQGNGLRLWTIAVQLYAVRSQHNWGHGDFSDLARLVDLASYYGAAAIGLNPLHALSANEPSPYSPSSRCFLNALYIDVEAIPEFPGLVATGLDQTIKALRASTLIPYADVARAKITGLRAAYARFCSVATADRRADFDAYRTEQGEELLRYACFQHLRDRFAPLPWPQWPQPWCKPKANDVTDLRARHTVECEFHEFVQWVADRQLRACRDRARACGMPIGLYVDLAIGIDPHGADAWSQQDIVLTSVSIGAPPDEFNQSGQNWGLVPFNPHSLALTDFAALRRLLRESMRYAGAIRIDHVLGLKRMYLIPQGFGAADGAYVRFPFEAMLRVVAEESLRFRCVVIGEDLGTVPDGFRETVRRWGLWSYRVMLFERESSGHFKPPKDYPADAIASFNTHDLPSLSGWLQSHDLRSKRMLGLDPGETDENRRRAQQLMQTAMRQWTPSTTENDITKVASFLAATPSRLAAISLDDILGEVEQINIPGTTDEHPNWRRKLPLLLEDLERHRNIRRVADVFAQAGRTVVVSPSQRDS